MVENIESLRAEVQSKAFGKLEAFLETGIQVPCPGPAECISTQHVGRKWSEIIDTQGCIEGGKVIRTGNNSQLESVRTNRRPRAGLVTGFNCE